MPESVQSCFELSIHLSVKRISRELLLKIVRGKNTGKCMESSKHNWTPSGTATSFQFCSQNPFPNAKSFQFMNFLEAMFYENYLTSDFHTNTVISSSFAYSSKMTSKTVIRPIRNFHIGIGMGRLLSSRMAGSTSVKTTSLLFLVNNYRALPYFS